MSKEKRGDRRSFRGLLFGQKELVQPSELGRGSVCSSARRSCPCGPGSPLSSASHLQLFFTLGSAASHRPLHRRSSLGFISDQFVDQ